MEKLKYRVKKIKFLVVIIIQQSALRIFYFFNKNNELNIAIEKNREYLPLSEPLTTNHQFRVNACLPGKIDEIELPIHISNVAFLDPKNSKPTRLKYEINKKEKIRLTVSSGSKVWFRSNYDWKIISKL